ncbi:MAG: hypothetical protein ACLFPV_11520 [Spirochaetaceae bacterium]
MMPEDNAAADLIDSARAFLGLALEDARNALGGGVEQVAGDHYGRMRDVVSLESTNAFPGTLYVKAGEVRLVRVDHNGLRDLGRSALCSKLGGDFVRLPSRAGKQAEVLLYANKGIAFSCRGESLHFLEVFGPCTQKEYEDRYYRPPGAFIR